MPFYLINFLKLEFRKLLCHSIRPLISQNFSKNSKNISLLQCSLKTHHGSIIYLMLVSNILYSEPEHVQEQQLKQELERFQNLSLQLRIGFKLKFLILYIVDLELFSSQFIHRMNEGRVYIL